MNLRITPTDLPGLFQESDAIALKAQKVYVNLTRLVLLLTVGAPSLAIIIAAYAIITSDEIVISILKAFLVVVLVISTILTLILRHRNLEQDWYKARAVAESTKTLAWKFMTQSEPYRSEESERRYLEDLKQVLAEAGNGSYIHSGTVKEAISENMGKVRSMAYPQRLKTYLKDRLLDQQQWYSQKAATNNSLGNQWYWIIIILQILAIIAAILPLLFPSLRIVLVSVFTTSAASAYAWLQLKQYKSVGQAYSFTANELNIIGHLSNEVKDDQQLSDFVINAENAISREHTTWVAKRIGFSFKKIPE